MKAAQIEEYGGEDVLQVVETEKPKPEQGQVLVEVYAAGVNPFDWKIRDGVYKDFMPVTFPATLGGDLAGVVAEVPDGTEGFEPGQEVFGQANAVGKGSYAEFAAVKTAQLAIKPKSLNFIYAAAVPLTGASAYQAIHDHIKLQPDQKILIHGGAGGIGSIAIQLAKHVGAYVATTVSERDIDYVKSLGADDAIDYKAEDFSEKLRGFDAVFDTVGGETTAKSYGVLKENGCLVSMASKADEALVREFKVKFTNQFTRTTTERLSKIAELIDLGVLTINVDKVFNFEQASEALEYQKTEHPRGKVVIRIKP